MPDEKVDLNDWADAKERQRRAELMNLPMYAESGYEPPIEGEPAPALVGYLFLGGVIFTAGIIIFAVGKAVGWW